jgi:Ulp1 family protease
MDSDPVYLSYKNVCLRKSDVECLKPYNLINDMCISFYYEILNEKLKKFENEFFLFDPASTSMIIFDDDMEDLYDMFSSVNLVDRKYLFMPINDNTNKYKVGGGDHWGLLIYQKTDETFFYLDSMCNYIKNTDILATKISILLKYSGSSEKKLNTDEKKIKIIKTLEENKFQLNSYDCGMFILAFSEAIMDHIFSPQTQIVNQILDKEKINAILLSNINQNKIPVMRKNILKKIEVLKLNK